MAFKIGRTSDIRKSGNFHLKTLIYGVPKVGKTRLAKTVKLLNGDDSRLLYVGVDPGQLSIADRDFSTIPAVGEEIEWGEDTLNAIYDQVKASASDYDMIYVDGLDEIGDKLLRQYKLGTRDGRMAYGQLGDFASDWVKRMRDIPSTSIVFVTHMDQTQDDRGALIYKPAFPGNSIKNQLQAWFDLIGCMRFVPDANGDMMEMIQFSSRVDPRYESGDRSGLLDPFEKPDLGAIFSKIQAGGVGLVQQINPYAKVNADDLKAFGLWLKANQMDGQRAKDEAKLTFNREIQDLNNEQLAAIKISMQDSRK